MMQLIALVAMQIVGSAFTLAFGPVAQPWLGVALAFPTGLVLAVGSATLLLMIGIYSAVSLLIVQVLMLGGLAFIARRRQGLTAGNSLRALAGTLRL